MADAWDEFETDDRVESVLLTALRATRADAAVWEGRFNEVLEENRKLWHAVGGYREAFGRLTAGNTAAVECLAEDYPGAAKAQQNIAGDAGREAGNADDVLGQMVPLSPEEPDEESP